MSISKNTKKSWLTLAITLTLIAIIIWQVKDRVNPTVIYNEVMTQLIPGAYWGLVLVLIMAPMNWFFEAMKWRVLMSKVQPMKLRTAIASVLTGMSFAFISPGKVGDFAGRILYLGAAKRLRGVVATIVGSFAHVVVTCLMASLGFIYLLSQTSLSIIWTLALVVWLMTAGILLLYFNINRFTFKKVQGRKWLNKIIIAFKILKRYDKKILLRVLFYSFLKLATYTTQFVIVTQLFGSPLSFGATYMIAAGMFWLIMVIPSFLIADVIVRGYVAHLLFVETGISASEVPVMAGTYLIWLVNWVIPSLLGALTFFIYKTWNNVRASKFTS